MLKKINYDFHPPKVFLITFSEGIWSCWGWREQFQWYSCMWWQCSQSVLWTGSNFFYTTWVILRWQKTMLRIHFTIKGKKSRGWAVPSSSQARSYSWRLSRSWSWSCSLSEIFTTFRGGWVIGEMESNANRSIQLSWSWSWSWAWQYLPKVV